MRVRHAFKIAVFVAAVFAAPSHAASIASAISTTSAHLEAASVTSASSPVLRVSFVASGGCGAVVRLAVLLAVGVGLFVSFAVVVDDIGSGGPIVLEGASTCEAVTAATFVAANVGRHVLGASRKVLAVVLVVRLHVEVIPVVLLLRLLVASTRVPASASRSVLAATIVVLARM